jgi:death-on-curing protein
LRLILMDHGFDIQADQDEKYNMVMSVIRAEMRFEGIKDWIVSRISKRKVL